VAERARAGKLRPTDIADATFTISNLGMYQVDEFTAIIVQPQAAILAVGSIVDRVVAVDGKPTVRPMMTLTLSCDHRAADGARAAAFLNDLAQAVYEPSKWLA
jgi:pyruvate dehydrogenase E2 component (dihydrolipoamide acetyltransferase)